MIQYTDVQTARQERRKAIKLARKASRAAKNALRVDHVLIVAHRGLPRTFGSGQLGSFVFKHEQKEEVLGKLLNADYSAYQGYCDWETDTYTSSNGQRHLWKLPHSVEHVQK